MRLSEPHHENLLGLLLLFSIIWDSELCIGLKLVTCDHSYAGVKK